MRPQGNSRASGWPENAVLRHGVLALSGYSLDIRVWRGRLRVEDGIGGERRRLLIHRATGGLKRLVVIGHTGSISLDAIRWLSDVGASYTQIDGDGKLLAAFGGGGGYEQPRLRRAQAVAIDTPEGLAISRWLIDRKLRGQTATLDRLSEDLSVERAVEQIEGARLALAGAPDARAVRMLESAAAIAYWQAWSGVPVRFAGRDREGVPAHWLTLVARKSALTGQPRSATNPANALLNYLYAIVESEAAIAARIIGLDPGIGLFHLDARYRPSLASDLMEPVRPQVDRYVLDTLATRRFGAADFFETRTGICRLMPPLAKELASTMLHWRPLVGKVAEDVAHALLDPPDWDPLPRPITRPQRGGTTRRPPRRPDGRTSLLPVQPRCSTCGKPMPNRQARTCSAECDKQARVRGGHSASAKGQERLRQLRAQGKDPTATPEARARRGVTIARRRAEQRAWDEAHPERPDREIFEREILPALASVSVRQIMQATGLSTAQAWRIRSGQIVPHPRWWEMLAQLGGEGPASRAG